MNGASDSERAPLASSRELWLARVFWGAFSAGTLFVVGLWLQGLGAAPVYDDIDLIQGARTRGLADFALSALPFDPNYWRPLPMAALWLAQSLGSAGGRALSGVLAALILWGLALEFWRAHESSGGNSAWGSGLLGAAAPALLAHPAVAGLWSWQSAIFDLSLCVGLVWGWIALRWTRERGPWASGATALLVVLFCGLCKEAPLAIVAMIAASGATAERQGGRRALWMGAGAGALAVILLRWAALGAPLAQMSAQPSALAMAPEAAAGYLASLAGFGAPLWVSAYDAAPWALWPGAIAGAAALAIVWRLGKAGRWASAAVGAHIGALCLALGAGLVSGDGHYAARHVAFAPLLLALLAAPWAARGAGKAGRVGLILCSALFLAWGAAGARESLFWSASEEFWARAEQEAPNSPVAAGWRVGELRRKGDFERARAVCERSIPAAASGPASAPATGLAYFCATLALERGRFDDARRISVIFEPSWGRAPELAYLAGLAALRQNDREGALSAFVAALDALGRMPASAKGAERRAIEAKLSQMLVKK